jgi:hypothetical protein
MRTPRARLPLVAVGSLFILGIAASAQVPQLVNYQGRVAVGAPAVNFEGVGQFRFALVDAVGASTFWSNAPDTTPADGVPDSPVSLTVTKGLYSVLLGDTSLTNMAAIPAGVWTNPDVRLRVWFNDGTNGTQLVSPDQRLAPNGYLPYGAVGSDAIAAGAVTNSKVAPNAIGSGNISAGAINGTHLTAASLDASHLTVPVAPSTGQVLSFNGTSLQWTAPGGVFALNGTSAFYNGGNVGIGTMTPGYKLDVNGELRASTVFAGSGGYEQNSTGPFYINSAGVVGGRFAVTAGGDVGIGTMNPTRPLDVNGIMRSSAGVVEARGVSPYFEAQDTNAGGIYASFQSIDGRARIFANGERISVDGSTGNIGIGTTAPSQRLEVSNGAIIASGFANRAANTGKALEIGMDGTRTILQSYDRTASSLIPAYFAASSYEFSQGSVGIGMAPTQSILSVGGGTLVAGPWNGGHAQGAYLEWNKDGSGGRTYLLNQRGGGSGGTIFGEIDTGNTVTEHMRITFSGNVGINDSSPSYRLQVGGNIECSNLFETSDARYKTNVRTIDGALETILRLRGVSFDWRRTEFPEKDFSKERQIGFIAQEVRDILPSVISEDSEGYLSLQYDAIIPMLAEAVKELHQKHEAAMKAKDAEIAALKRQLAAQAERDRAIEARLSRLEQRPTTGVAAPVRAVFGK